MEGYTDVMMAHQHGVTHVVATMGTALNEAHVRQLRRFVPKVVLVFDADAGGETGVDRALEIFVGCDVELAIATLPEGLDPCDLIAAQGAGTVPPVLAGAVDALDFKLNQLLEKAGDSVEGTQAGRGRDPRGDGARPATARSGRPGQAGTAGHPAGPAARVAAGDGVGAVRGVEGGAGRREPTRTAAGSIDRSSPAVSRPEPTRSSGSCYSCCSRSRDWSRQAYVEIRPEELEHPGLQQLLAGLYHLHEDGEHPELDGLRDVVGQPATVAWAMDYQEVGRAVTDRGRGSQDVLDGFRDRATRATPAAVDGPAAGGDDGRGSDSGLLREIQDLDDGPGLPSPAASRPDPAGAASPTPADGERTRHEEDSEWT